MPELKTPSSSYLPHVARGALINFTGIFARMAFVYVYTFLLARVLPVDQVGQYFLMVTMVSLMGLGALVGLDYGVVRYVALYAGEGRTAQARKTLWASLVVGVPVGLAFMAAVIWQAPLISDLFLGSAAGSVKALRIFALEIPLLVAARLFNVTTQGMHKMQYQVYSRDMGEQVLKVGFSAVVLALGAGLLGVVWANVAALILAAALSLYYALRVLRRAAGSIRTDAGTTNLPADNRESPPESPAKAMLRYAYPLALANIMVALWLQVDTLMLGLLGTTEDVGYYGVALKVSLFSAKIITAFGLVFTPVIADLWNRGKNKELHQLYITVTRWIFALSFPLFLIMVLFSDSVMRIFGTSFTAGGGALVFLAVGQLMNAATGTAGVMVLMSGRSKLELFNVFTTLAIDTLLCYVLIPRYGVVGAAIANMTALVVVNVMRVIEIQTIMKMLAYDRSYLKPLFAGTVSATLTFFISKFVLVNVGFRQLLILAVSLVFFYVLTLAVLGLDECDKMVFKQVGNRVARLKAT